MSSSVGVRLANVPWMATALKRCIVIDSRWKRNALSRESSDSCEMRLPSSFRNWNPAMFHGWGTKVIDLCQLSIFQWLPVCRGLCCSTRRVVCWWQILLSQSVCDGHIPSHTFAVFFHGISVRPYRPVGSLTEEMFAFPSARQTKWFKITIMMMMMIIIINFLLLL